MATARVRGNATGGQSPVSDIFDLDQFITSARKNQIKNVFSKEDFKKYDKAITDLEKSIREKKHTKYTQADKELNILFTSKRGNAKLQPVITEFNKLREFVKKANTRGVEWFQCIKVNKDSEMPLVATGVASGNIRVPEGKQTDILNKLFAIEKILEDAPADKIGAKPKNRTLDDVLEAIARLSTDIVKDRAKAGTSGLNKEAIAKRHLKVVQDWMTQFEKQMTEPCLNEENVEAFKNPIPPSVEMDAICEILKRLIGEAKKTNIERNAHDKDNTEQVKKLCYTLTGRKYTPNEETDIKKLLEFSLSELNLQIVKLSNQANTLKDVTRGTNEGLVTKQKKTQSKKLDEQQQNNSQGNQTKTLTAILEIQLNELEEECSRNQARVKQLDDEIDALENDLEDWNNEETIEDVEIFGKCSLKAIKAARVKLQTYKKAKVDNSKQDNVKQLKEAIAKLCHDNDPGDSTKKDENYEVMIKRLGNQLKKNQASLKSLEDELKGLQEENENGPKTSKNTIEITTLINMAKSAKKYLKTLQDERNSKKDNMKKLKDTITKMCKDYDIVDTTDKDDKYVAMIKRLESRLKDDQTSLKKLEQELNGLQEGDKNTRRNSRTPESNTDIGAFISMAQSAKLNLESRKQELDQVQKRVQQLRSAVSEWKTKAEHEENEKVEYMTRLTKVASAKLTNNNPNIEDLSDPNRQTKLAEEYSQLYDNEWANAYEAVEKEGPGESEESTINYLLNILTTVYNKCADVRTQQLTGMNMALLQPAHFFCLLNKEQDQSAYETTGKEGKQKDTTKTESKNTARSKPDTTKTEHKVTARSKPATLGAIQSQSITELGKQTYLQALLDITEYFQRSQIDWFNRKRLDSYTTKCIEICWLMNIHSPPVCLDAIAKKGDTFDKTKYREYTARGKKVKFVVWPAILLHKDGPTLGKGVAQGMG